MLVDTHCHIHEDSYSDSEGAYSRALSDNVTKMICVGTSEESSHQALAFAELHGGAYASIAVHPHDTKDGYGDIRTLAASAQLSQKLVAIGEIGLDYFYTHSPREVQIEALESQIQTALDHNLPVIFHVREAFDDFWPIFDNFHGIRGELHSFTDSMKNLDEGLKRGLYVGINGISTFTKDADQQAMFTAIPADKLLLETDAPYLTPVPYRGKVNEPAFVQFVANHAAASRSLSVQQIADATTANAHALFAL